MLAAFAHALSTYIAEPPAADHRPNIVFLVVESTDGRTWTPGYSNSVLELPAIRSLQQRGATFTRHYSNAPVCCPSRASFWSGRHAHNIPHNNSGIPVRGVWNNFEGLPDHFDNRIDQVLARAGYSTRMSGKSDWSTGSHSENVRLQAWTMYTRFSYDVNASGGWNGEDWYGSGIGCSDEGGVSSGNASVHEDDWVALRGTTRWIREQPLKRPWFAYQGMLIVHPPYNTNERWFASIDPDKVSVPAWRPLSELHPCDFQSSMLKGCTPANDGAAAFYSVERRRRVRRVYLAMIAEFDAMVGEYVRAVDESGVTKNTVFIVTSDHGDMQMEKQQFYKMVPYEASASVPMVIADGRSLAQAGGGHRVNRPTQLIDIFPTVMDLAQVPKASRPSALEGASLLPLLSRDGQRDSKRPPFVVSQFHGDDIAMSWFLVVQEINGSAFKLVRWGTGGEVPSLLFNLTADPDEDRNLLHPRPGERAGSEVAKAIERKLDSSLRSVVDYPAVALDVARYGQASFANWKQERGDGWKDAMRDPSLRWSHAWENAPLSPFKAIDEWLGAEPKVLPCRSSLSWPP